MRPVCTHSLLWLHITDDHALAVALQGVSKKGCVWGPVLHRVLVQVQVQAVEDGCPTLAAKGPSWLIIKRATVSNG